MSLCITQLRNLVAVVDLESIKIRHQAFENIIAFWFCSFQGCLCICAISGGGGEGGQISVNSWKEEEKH